jgi:hypothetical protein
VPRITIEALNADGEPRRWTLTERIVAENLDSDHYVHQLTERLSWATADAEDLEADFSKAADNDPVGAWRSPQTVRTRGDSRARSPQTSANTRARA